MPANLADIVIEIDVRTAREPIPSPLL